MRKDLSGRKFGRLTVISRVEGPRARWKCFCDCGGKTIAQGCNLKDGHTSSCVCFRKESSKRRSMLRPYEGLYNALVKRCAAVGREVMSFEEFLTFTNKKECSYCGEELKWTTHRTKHGKEFVGRNLDRVNSEKGYTRENCVPCCPSCNRMKSDMKLSEFTERIKRIYGRYASHCG